MVLYIYNKALSKKKIQNNCLLLQILSFKFVPTVIIIISTENLNIKF